jgi:hypothetical protein
MPACFAVFELDQVEDLILVLQHQIVEAQQSA